MRDEEYFHSKKRASHLDILQIDRVNKMIMRVMIFLESRSHLHASPEMAIALDNILRVYFELDQKLFEYCVVLSNFERLIDEIDKKNN